MNWNQDWDLESNGNGWDDGRCNDPSGPSVAFLPRSIVKTITDGIVTMLAVAGLAGALFQAYLCLRIVAQVTEQPHGVTTPSRSVSDKQHAPSSPRMSRNNLPTTR